MPDGHRTEARGVHHHCGTCREARQRERGDPHAAHVDAGSACGLGVAADRVDVTAELGAPQQEAPGDHEREHDRHDPWDPAVLTAGDATVGVADRNQDDSSGRHHRDLRHGHRDRRRHETAAPAAPVRERGDDGVQPNTDGHSHPPDRRTERAVDDVEDDVVGDPDRAAVIRVLVVDDPDQEPFPEQESGERDDEGR